MPLYEYACGTCGSHLEVRQRMTEDPLTTCPRCDTDALERLVSMSSFALKGGGWYADGYGSPKKEDETSANGDAKADSSKTDGSKTDGSKTDGSKTDGKKDAGEKASKTETKSSDSSGGDSRKKAAANG